LQAGRQAPKGTSNGFQVFFILCAKCIHQAFILSTFYITMKRKYKKTKKGHARRNATIKRKKRTRRQRGGAKVIVHNWDVPDNDVRNGQDYNIMQVEYDDHDSIQHVFIGTARANIILQQTCGAMVGPLSGRVGEPRCDIFTYQPVNGTLAFYNPDKTIRRTYQGHLADGRMHGHGKMTFNTHPVFREYEGDFERGMMHGRGTMDMTNGDRYVGDFQGDMMHGTGTITFHDGSRYVGDVVDGKMHGVGDVYDETGSLVFKARFENNEPIERIEEMEEEEEEEEEPAPAPHSGRPGFFDPQ
jgi:hypothetical protein